MGLGPRTVEVNDYLPDDLAMEACCAIKYFPEVDSLQSEKVARVVGSFTAGVV